MASTIQQPTYAVTTGGKERIPSAIAILTPAFSSPSSGFSFRYIFSHLSEASKNATLPSFFHTVLTAAALSNATFDFLDDDNCVGVLLPPGEGEVGNPVYLLSERIASVEWGIGNEALGRLMGAVEGEEETETETETEKGELLGREDRFYAVLIAGTNAEARGKGLCTALMRHYQGIAGRRGLPICLTTTSEGALRVYTRCGFKVVKEGLIGKGKCDPEGRREEGGSGVKEWSLVWRPPASAS